MAERMADGLNDAGGLACWGLCPATVSLPTLSFDLRGCSWAWVLVVAALWNSMAPALHQLHVLAVAVYTIQLQQGCECGGWAAC